MTSFLETQKAFAHNLRNHQPKRHVDGVTSKRMDLYQSLIYNNIESIVHKAFPIITSILTKEQWRSLVKVFIAEYKCDSPYFRDIPQSFVAFVDSLPKSELPFPFIPELAHYEWIELDVELQISNDLSNTHIETYDAKKHNLFLLPTTRVVAYQYPVHQICKNLIPSKPSTQPHFFCVYRTENYQVKFMQLNVLSASLLEIISAEPMAFQQALKQLTELLSIDFADDFIKNGNKLCCSFVSKNILGFSGKSER